MNYRPALAAIMAIVMASLVACGGGDGKRPATPSAVPKTATPTGAASPATAEPSAADAIAAVRADLATRVSEVELQHMEIVSITRHDWPDACLGLTSPADGLCAQVIIPGYEITMSLPLRGTWIFRTDLHSRVSLANVIPEG
jgi:hypothetical protein